MPEKTYPCGECPLSKEGICESEGLCPYGCDDHVNDWHIAEQEKDTVLLATDRIYVLHRMLVYTYWVQRFTELKAGDYIVTHHQELLASTEKYATPWVQEKLKQHYAAFYADRNVNETGLDVQVKWLKYLRRLYQNPNLN
jgi:hypothetical protein